MVEIEEINKQWKENTILLERKLKNRKKYIHILKIFVLKLIIYIMSLITILDNYILEQRKKKIPWFISKQKWFNFEC